MREVPGSNPGRAQYFLSIFQEGVTEMLMGLVQQARLAQSVEHETLNLRVVGSSPTLGATIFLNLGDWLPRGSV